MNVSFDFTQFVNTIMTKCEDASIHVTWRRFLSSLLKVLKHFNKQNSKITPVENDELTLPTLPMRKI